MEPHGFPMGSQRAATEQTRAAGPGEPARGSPAPAGWESGAERAQTAETPHGSAETPLSA